MADENIEVPLLELLREAGHDILSIAELDAGITDVQVFDILRKENIPLLTADKDFGEMTYRLGYTAAGIVLVRLNDLPFDAKAEILIRAIQEHGAEFTGAFTVVKPGALRIRHQRTS